MGRVCRGMSLSWILSLIMSWIMSWILSWILSWVQCLSKVSFRAKYTTSSSQEHHEKKVHPYGSMRPNLGLANQPSGFQTGPPLEASRLPLLPDSRAKKGSSLARPDTVAAPFHFAAFRLMTPFRLAAPPLLIPVHLAALRFLTLFRLADLRLPAPLHLPAVRLLAEMTARSPMEGRVMRLGSWVGGVARRLPPGRWHHGSDSSIGTRGHPLLRST